jgi:hypothetical protein
VGTEEPSTWTWEVLINPVPVMVIWTGPEGLATRALGEIEVMVSDAGAVSPVEPDPEPPQPTKVEKRSVQQNRSGANLGTGFSCGHSVQEQDGLTVPIYRDKENHSELRWEEWRG